MVEHALEHGLAVADVERELDVGVRGDEGVHERRHERLGRGRDRRDAQPRAASGASCAARRPWSSRPITSAAYGAKAAAGGGRPDAAAGALEQLALELAPSAATAAETDGCVTTSSSAAAVTEPPRTTARNAVAG